jgi:hypothetical protein
MPRATGRGKVVAAKIGAVDNHIFFHAEEDKLSNFNFRVLWRYQNSA